MHPPETVAQITEIRSRHGLRLTWTWRTPLTDLLTLALAVGLVARLTAFSDVPLPVDLLLGGLLLAAVQVWWNVTTVAVSAHRLTLTAGPLTLRGPTRLERRDIAGIRTVEQRTHWLRQCTLVADVHRDGKLEEVQLLVRSPRATVVRHLEQRIRAALLGR
ncbi:MAG: hypothetical protein R3F59_37870 [Myxococcota bacterium]